MRTSPFAIVLLAGAALAACATPAKPPAITYDAKLRPAILKPEPPKPVEIVEVPKLLPLPDQLKPIPAEIAASPEPANPRTRVALANRAARMQPTASGYINAVQVYPFSCMPRRAK
jgi:hypothetical protein